MAKEIYSGEGWYDTNYDAAYTVYLPDLSNNERYEFTTNDIQNFSCSNHSNRILIFMKIIGASNYDLSSEPLGKGEKIVFNLSNIKNPNNYPAINTKEDINVLIMHDSCTDFDHARENIYCKSDYAIYNYRPLQTGNDCGDKGIRPDEQPKRVKIGTLRAPIK